MPTPVAGSVVRPVNCLDACERATVIVVRPSAEGRKAGGRPVRLGPVNDPDAARDITAWVEAGGPGLAEPPGVLDLCAFHPSRRLRRTLPDGQPDALVGIRHHDHHVRAAPR